MFTPAVLDHFRHPRNAGELPDATHTVEVSNPVCGDVLRLAVRMEAEHIAEARFLCRGCTTAIAAASYLAEQLQGRAPCEMVAVNAHSISLSLGKLAPATFHGAQLAESALRALLVELRKG
jgi:nitrogen fixation NifU-like protein